MHACVHRDSCVMANHLPIPRCQPATRWVLDVSKTRLLNVLAAAIPARERIVTIEDSNDQLDGFQLPSP
jgi:hypothetical protein